MAYRVFSDVQALDKQIKIISGSFAPAGTGTPTAASGKGYSVAWSSTGSYTVTLEDSFPSCVCAIAKLQLASADDKFCQLGAIDVKTNKTVVINVWDKDDAVVADVSADANNRVNFVLYLKNSEQY